MFRRRLRQWRVQRGDPVLGTTPFYCSCKEAILSEWDSLENINTQGDLMFYGFNYADPKDIQPTLFMSVIKGGLVETDPRSVKIFQ